MLDSNRTEKLYLNLSWQNWIRKVLLLFIMSLQLYYPWFCCPLCIIPKFHLIVWREDFVETQSFGRTVSAEFWITRPKLCKKLCIYTKFTHQEIRWNHDILCTDSLHEKCINTQSFLQSEHRKIQTRNNSVLGHFSRSDRLIIDQWLFKRTRLYRFAWWLKWLLNQCFLYQMKRKWYIVFVIIAYVCIFITLQAS